jgi:hypothetical protein
MMSFQEGILFVRRVDALARERRADDVALLCCAVARISL